MPLNRTLAEVLKAHKDATLDDIRVCLPATVTAVNPVTQTVDVQAAIKNPLFDEFGDVTFEELPGFKDVPIGVMRGNGFFVWVPVSIGDSVLLLFSDLAMDTWQTAGGGAPVQPGWLGKHSSASPIAIPCIAPISGLFTTVAANAGKVVIGKDASPAQITISDTEIDLGVPSAVPLAKQPPLDTLLSALSTWITATQAALVSIPTFVDPAKSTYATATTAATAAITAARAALATITVKGQ